MKESPEKKFFLRYIDQNVNLLMKRISITEEVPGNALFLERLYQALHINANICYDLSQG